MSVNILLLIFEVLLATLSFLAKLLLPQHLCPTALIEHTNEGDKRRLG